MLAEQWFSSRRPVISVEEKLGFLFFTLNFLKVTVVPVVDVGRQPA
jgi:hypothetical protein